MHITVLMGGDNIHARILVDEMVKSGIVPDLIINEEGTPRANKIKDFLDNKFDNPPSVKNVATKYVEVEKFDDDKTIKLIKEAKTDYLVIAGVGAIIRKNILSIATPLNVHPGLLPEYRGLDPVLWAVDNGGPTGATVHVMDEGIDTGEILISRAMPWMGAQSLLELRMQCIRWGSKLLTEFLKDPAAYPAKKQDEDRAEYFSSYPQEQQEAIEQKFADYKDRYANSGVRTLSECEEPSYFIKGEKVGLRTMHREDLDLYQKWLNDKEVTKYLEMGWRPYTERDLNNVYEESNTEPLSIIFVICDLETGKPIGTTGFYFIHWPGRRAQYRILIGESCCHGKGIGTEVNKLMVKHGFERLNFHTIYLGVNAENEGAVKSYEKAGYVHEGRHRDFVYNDGKYYDSLSMSILSTEYFEKLGK